MFFAVCRYQFFTMMQQLPVGQALLIIVESRSHTDTPQSVKFLWMNFDVLLTVHLSIFISVINQLDAQNFCFTISLFHASSCFEHMCSKHEEA